MQQRELEAGGQIGFGQTFKSTDYDETMKLAEEDPEAVKKRFQDMYDEMKQFIPKEDDDRSVR